MTSAPRRDTRLRVSYLHLACGAFVVLWLAVGAASSWMTPLPTAAKLAVFGVWLALAAARSMSFISAIVINAWPLLVMLLVSILYAYEVARAGQDSREFGYLLVAFALLCFYSQPEVRRERHMLMGVMAIDLAITGVRTLVALQTDPQLSRYLATTETNRTEVYGSQDFSGLGGYGFAYSLVAVVLVLMYYLVRSRRGRVSTGLVVGFGLIALFELAFTTAIVLAFALGAIHLVQDLVGRRELRILVYAAALLGWITGLYSAILNGLSDQTWVTEVVRQRLAEFSAFLAGEGTSGSDLGKRIEHWQQSIDIIMTSVPLGLAGQSVPSQNDGGHSQWLDLPARYGVYALLMVPFLVFAWRLSRRAIATEIEPLRRAWTYFLLLGLVNPLLLSTIVLTWMFFIPSLVSWLGEKLPLKHESRDAVVL